MSGGHKSDGFREKAWITDVSEQDEVVDPRRPKAVEAETEFLNHEDIGRVITPEEITEAVKPQKRGWRTRSKDDPARMVGNWGLIFGIDTMAWLMHRSKDTIRRWIRYRDFPALRYPNGEWVTSTGLIDQWLLAQSRVTLKQWQEYRIERGKSIGDIKQ